MAMPSTASARDIISAAASAPPDRWTPPSRTMPGFWPGSCAAKGCPPRREKRCCAHRSRSPQPINSPPWRKRSTLRTARSTSPPGWALYCSRGATAPPSTRAVTTTGRTTWRCASRRRNAASSCCPTACAPRRSIPCSSARSSATAACRGPGNTTQKARRRRWPAAYGFAATTRVMVMPLTAWLPIGQNTLYSPGCSVTSRLPVCPGSTAADIRSASMPGP